MSTQKAKNLDKLRQGVDFDYFWDRYAPHWDQAVDAIREKHKINQTAASVMIDMEFDARQKILYKKDPLDAVRDLTYILKKKENQAKNINRQKTKSVKFGPSGHWKILAVALIILS